MYEEDDDYDYDEDQDEMVNMMKQTINESDEQETEQETESDNSKTPSSEEGDNATTVKNKNGKDDGIPKLEIKILKIIFKIRLLLFQKNFKRSVKICGWNLKIN